MSDCNLQSAIIYRLQEGGEAPVILAKHSHAFQYQSRNGTSTPASIRDQSLPHTVASFIKNDPPLSSSSWSTDEESNVLLGGFKFVQTDNFRVVYGADREGLCAAVVTNVAYPSRVAIQMLQELYTNVMAATGSVDIAEIPTLGLDQKAKTILSAICKKYDNLVSVDKVSELHQKVQLVTDEMDQNLARVLQNVDTAESMEKRSAELTQGATVFQTNARKLKRQMACKNLKLNLLIGSIVILVLVGILVPIVKKLHD